ncbi:MAG: hypothetical protein IT342_23660 [Candidatus Melainabacteria bacterium]|nr:hypothetical protein [Candidatus Melainabacteria bacterium]
MTIEYAQGKVEAQLSLSDEQKKETSERLLLDSMNSQSKQGGGDKNGKSLEKQPQGRLTDQQMSELEKVSQPMRPANNPSETFANAMRMYCQNEATRNELKNKCPDMYRYIEKYDRTELSRLGSDFFGINDYVRDENGDIVRNPNAWNPALA